MSKISNKLWENNQDNNSLAENIVFGMIHELNDRSGFDDWFSNIDNTIQNEILETLVEITEKKLL